MQLVTNVLMSGERTWASNVGGMVPGGRRPTYSEQKQYLFHTHKSNTDCPGIKPALPQRDLVIYGISCLRNATQKIWRQLAANWLDVGFFYKLTFPLHCFTVNTKQFLNINPRSQVQTQQNCNGY